MKPNRQPEPTELLAKSPHGTRRLTLQQHLLDTEHAAKGVFDLERRWGQAFCRFFRIPEAERPRFLLNLRVAALFHDIGKANQDFYDAVTQPGVLTQTLRHEHLSALILHLSEVRAWLRRNPSLDVEVITAAVLSHHLKAAMEGDCAWGQPRGGSDSVRLYLHHPQVIDTFRRVAQIASLTELPMLPEGPWKPAPPWAQALRDGLVTAARFKRDIEGNEARRSLLLATKAGLIVSDSVASGLVREGRHFDDWINDVAHAPPLAAEDIREHILDPRQRQIEALTGRPFASHRFQDLAAEQGPRALLLAACGAGKTLAAWRWAEAQLRAQRLGRVVFLYPTRGTATEGFRDYVAWAPETTAALVTGTARYELEEMRKNPSEGARDKRFELDEADARLFSLGLWPRRYFSATVDQFLSFMEHGYGGLCLLPVLADAAVIIDEVHSFDRHMFDVLISFLKTFDVPVLCMTATLPPGRRDELMRAGLRVYPTDEDRVELADLDEKERYPRYRIEPVAGEEPALVEAASAYRRGQRVLWVVNRVARCQALARRLQRELGPDVLCYHSRFCLKDRRTRHEKTVEAFQQKQRPAIAVTTQVCEMSLDLDADVLITEHAPVTALVQRFGRAHRRLDRTADFRARILTYPPDAHLPYDRKDLDAALTFLAELGTGDLSQRALAEALERHARIERDADGSARFLRGGYYATPGSLREVDEHAASCILDSHLPAAQAAQHAGKPLDPFLLSVPRRWLLPEDPRPPWLPRYLRIAPAERYDERLGFLADPGEPA